MADNDFDFDAFKALKLVQYTKEYCKTTIIKKSSAALIFLDYKMAGKKTSCVVIPFKKYPEAMKAFKAAKLAKESSAKKTGLAELTVAKGPDGKEEIIVDIKKGGIGPEMLMAKGADFFLNTIGIPLKAIGKAEDVEEEDAADTNSDNKETKEKSDTPSDQSVQKADRAAKMTQIKINIDKMMALAGKAPKEKLEENIVKYQTILDKLNNTVIDKEEQKMIDTIQTELDKLKKQMSQTAPAPTEGKKLTPEQKVKIKDNMAKINARLEAITKKLGI